MPCKPTAKDRAVSDEEPEQSDDAERFKCPFPDCKRSFAELWRLKVHFRAAPDVRGSGKERGHSLELTFCPKCRKELKPGKHHTGCRGTNRSGAPPAKRARQLRQPRRTVSGTLRATQSEHLPDKTVESSCVNGIEATRASSGKNLGSPQVRQASAPAQLPAMGTDPSLPPSDRLLSSDPPADSRQVVDGSIPAIFASTSREGGKPAAGAALSGFKQPTHTGRPPPHASSKIPDPSAHRLQPAAGAAQQQPKHQASAAPLILQSSLSRERCKRSGAWLKAFADAAAATAAPSAMWEAQCAARGDRGALTYGHDTMPLPTANLHTLPNPRPGANRLLSCPLPCTSSETSLYDPLDNLMVGAGSFGSRDAPLAPYEAFHPAPPPPRSQSLRLGDQSGPSPAFSLSGELPGDIIGLADDILFANPFAEAAGRHIGPRAQPLDPPLPLSTAQLCCLPGAQDRRVKGEEALPAMADFTAANPFELARQVDPNGADLDEGLKPGALRRGQALPGHVPGGPPPRPVPTFPTLASTERCLAQIQPHVPLLLPAPSGDAAEAWFGGVRSQLGQAQGQGVAHGWGKFDICAHGWAHGAGQQEARHCVSQVSAAYQLVTAASQLPQLHHQARLWSLDSVLANQSSLDDALPALPSSWLSGADLAHM